MAGPPGSGPNDTTWVPGRSPSPQPSDAPTWAPPPSTLALGASGDAGLESTGARLDPRPLIEPGTVIGDEYRVDGIIGSGAMGVVYRAHHLRLDRAVALKLRRTASLDHARLDREARAMARLSHPNVVAVYDVGTWDGDVYIAMEFVDGCSLRAWLESAKRPWRVVLDACMQAGAGLAAAHAAGIVHRDFKPDNVLVGADGRVRVADFGIARGSGRPIPRGPSDPSDTSVLGPDLTGTGGMPGTPAYMAPEQFGGVADAKSDVFAFSVVLYEALFGQRPFGGASLPELLFNVTKGNVRRPPADTEVPEVVTRLVLAGLAVDPAKRMPSVALLLELLGRAVLPRTGLRIAIAAGATGVALLAAAGVLAWWMWPEPQPQSGETADAVVIVNPFPGQSVVFEASAPETDAEEPEPPPPRIPTAEELAQKEREGLAALSATVRGEPVEDPDDFDGLMEADDQDIIKAALTGMLAKDAASHADKGNFVNPAWDGKSRLVCMMGDKFLIENVQIAVSGTAITAMYGCQLHLVGCDAEADTIVQAMMRSEVTVTGGTMKPKHAFVTNMFGFVTIAGVKVEGDPMYGVEASGGTTEIVDSDLRGATALRANQKARVRVKGGTLVGTKHAVEAMHGGVVELDGTERTGDVHVLHEGRVLEPVTAPK
jgi:predicted Ser/Thr protein kinase